MQQQDVQPKIGVRGLLLLACDAGQTYLEVCWVAKTPHRSTANAAHLMEM